MQCADIVAYVFSFDMFPKYGCVSRLWNSVFVKHMEKQCDTLISRYPEWNTNYGMISLNRAALNDDWINFRIIMQYNDNILCDDAIEIAHVFNKDNIVRLMYMLYSHRNSHSPIRAYYMWINHIEGKEKALDNMMNMLKYYERDCLCGKLTRPMKLYIAEKYGPGTFPSKILMEYKGIKYMLNHKLDSPSARVITRDHLTTYVNEIVDNTLQTCDLHPILYDIYLQHNPATPQRLAVLAIYTTRTTPSPSGKILYTFDHHVHIMCDNVVKKTGKTCKNKAKYFIDNVKCCGIHVKPRL